MAGADPHHILNVGGLLREYHRIRRLRLQPGRGMGVLVAHGLRGDEAVAEPGGELFHRRGDRLRLGSFRVIGDGRAHLWIPPAEIPWQRIFGGSRDVDPRKGMNTMTTQSGTSGTDRLGPLLSD